MIARIIRPFDLRCRRTRLIMPALGIYSISDYKIHRYFLSDELAELKFCSRQSFAGSYRANRIFHRTRAGWIYSIILLDYCLPCLSRSDSLSFSRRLQLSSVRSSRNVPLTRLSQRRDCRSWVHVLIRETNISLHFMSIVHTISSNLRSDSISATLINVWRTHRTRNVWFPAILPI